MDKIIEEEENIKRYNSYPSGYDSGGYESDGYESDGYESDGYDSISSYESDSDNISNNISLNYNIIHNRECSDILPAYDTYATPTYLEIEDFKLNKNFLKNIICIFLVLFLSILIKNLIQLLIK